MSWRIKYAACSVQGSARKKNQDNLLCHEFFLPEDHTGTDGIWYEETDSLPALFCVFDGLGGEMKGEEASFFACESIRNQFIGRGIQRQKLGSERYVREICREADRRIQQYTGAKYQSGSTVAGILFARDDIICFHVGDSRIYRMRGRSLKRLTQDHICCEQKREGPVLSQALGIRADRTEIEPDILTFPFRDSDLYLLCTNGITQSLSGHVIRKILINNTDINKQAEMLVSEAVSRGSLDDGTVILCRLEQEGGNVMEGVQLPQHWSQWECTEVIGSGAYGTVYRGEKTDDRGNSSEAAIKIIRVPRDDSEASALYREYGSMEEVSRYYAGMISGLVDEIQTLMSLKGSRNIVQIEDYHVERRAEDEYGWTIYIRMEFLQSLSDYMMEHEMTEKDAVRLGMDICSALEECRKANIIHRDIKPDNILVTEDGQFKLGDFGVAKRLDVSHQSLSMKGTFNYMSPEVYYGKPYDHQADIYSLGLVLYRILNHNRDPFIDLKKQLVHFRDREEALGKRMSGQPVPAPAEASPAMAGVIRKACAFQPRDRYQTAALMAAALKQVLNGGASLDHFETLSSQTDSKKKKEVHLSEESTPASEEFTPASWSRKTSGKLWAALAFAVLVLAGIGGAIGNQVFLSHKEQKELIVDHAPCSPDGNATCTLDGAGLLTISGQGSVGLSKETGRVPWENNLNRIKEVVIEEGITSIGEMAFDGCTDLTRVRLPEGLIKIGDAAFQSCELLGQINMPKSLTEIGMGALDDTKWIQNQKDDQGYVIVNDILLKYYGTEERLELPDKIRSIAPLAFYNGEEATIREITLPKSLEVLGDQAFEDCSDLEVINGLEGNPSLKEVGNEVFKNTRWEENKAEKEHGFVIADGRLYSYLGNEKKILIPEEVTQILGYAFSENKDMEDLIISKNVESIGRTAFQECSYLKEIRFETDKLKELPRECFINCISLSEVSLPDSVESIGEDAFYGCEMLKKVGLPDNIKTIEKNAFSGCHSLREVAPIPDMKKSVIEKAFYETPWYEETYPKNQQ